MTKLTIYFIRSYDQWFYIEMNKMTCPHVNVLSLQIGDLFRIFEVPKNAITQL